MTGENQGRRGKEVTEIPESQESLSTLETLYTPDLINNIETIYSIFDTSLKPPKKRICMVYNDKLYKTRGREQCL
jgi:hypothetical protein